MRPVVSFSVFAAAIVLVACTDTYHPEYHPVTVTNFSQNVGYPVVVNNGTNAGERSPVTIVPGVSTTAPQAFATPPPPAEPPPGFFEHP